MFLQTQSRDFLVTRIHSIAWCLRFRAFFLLYVLLSIDIYLHTRNIMSCVSSRQLDVIPDMSYIMSG